MQRTLIVARLDTEDPGRIADIFGESDASELPGLIGVSRRTTRTSQTSRPACTGRAAIRFTRTSTTSSRNT